MVKSKETLLLLLAIVIGVLLFSLGIMLDRQTTEPVSDSVKLILLPGTFVALIFPGIHADEFIRYMIFFNLIIYEPPVLVALYIIRRNKKGSHEKGKPGSGSKS